MTKVFVTITHKNKNAMLLPLWNRTQLQLVGDTTDLNTMIKEMNEIKAIANREINKAGFAFSAMNVKVEFA